MRKHLILAFSLANLCFFSAWREVLSPQGLSYLYYWKEYPGYAALAALIVNVLLLASIFLFGFHLICRWDGPGRKLGQLLFLAVFLRALNNIRAQFDSLSTSHLRLSLGRVGYFAVFALVLSLVALAMKRYGLSRVARAAALIVLIWSPFGVLGLVQATWLAVKYGRAVSREPTPAALNPTASVKARVVWLIFDEMDQRLAFAERPAGLSLPEFDRLRGEALFATNAFPPAGHTSQSIPALLTGKLIAAVRPAGPSELLLTLPGHEEPVGWNKTSNIFSEARANGVNTALVGWYHPYCRVIGNNLNRCYWQPATQRLDQTQLSFKKNFIRQLANALRLVPFTDAVQVSLLRATARDYRAEHLGDYLSLMRQAEDAVTNKEFGLLFIHLPVPHPPYVYDRGKSVLSTTTEQSGYLDNLALADQALGDLRKTMERAGTWEGTTVVVSSDHWWRSDYWQRQGIFWTKPDQALSGNRVDHRVPFIVRLPGQQSGIVYDAPCNTVLSRDLILEVLMGKLSSPGELTTWLDAHRTIGESPYQGYEDSE